MNTNSSSENFQANELKSNNSYVLLKKVKSETRDKFRRQMGLSPDTTEISKRVSITNFVSHSKLKEFRKSENLKSLIASSNNNFKSSENRLNDREKGFCLTPSPGKTHKTIVLQRKKEDFESLFNNFVHKKTEIPSIKKLTKEYLSKILEENEFSNEKTIKELKTPQTRFKTRKEITPKINLINHWENLDQFFEWDYNRKGKKTKDIQPVDIKQKPFRIKLINDSVTRSKSSYFKSVRSGGFKFNNKLKEKLTN